jgi:hypothetical protein
MIFIRNLRLSEKDSEATPSFLILKAYLRRWGLRLRMAESMIWGPWGAVAGLGVGLLLAVAARLWPLYAARTLAGLAGLLLLIGASVGLAVAWVRPRPWPRLALLFDRRFGLAQRMTTAVEIGTGQLQAVPALAATQLADAVVAAVHVDLRVALPLRASRRAVLVFGVLSVALALSLWLPNLQEDVLLQRASVRAAVEEQADELKAMQEQVAQAEGLTEDERASLLRALDEAAMALDRQLDRRRPAPEEALAALSEVEQALAELQNPSAADVQDGMERAAQRMADSELTHDIAEALANGDYQAAARELAAYSGTKGSVLTREEELELARELTEAAEALLEADPQLAKQLVQVAEDIERGDLVQARRAIRQAAQRIGEVGEQVRRRESIEEVFAQLQESREQIAQAGGTRQGGAEGEAQEGDMGGGKQSGSGQQTQPGHHEDAGTGDAYDRVYVPYRFNEEGVGVELDREGDQGVPVDGVPLPVPQEGTANVPYREVYADYAAQAGAALEGSHVPLGLKQYVRDYFSSLEP